MKKIVPRGDLVLIRKLPTRERTTEGGIHLPQSMKRDFLFAEVLDVGCGRWLECGERGMADDLEPGDVVLVREDRKDRMGTLISKSLIPVTPEEDTFLVAETDIYAIEQDDEPSDGAIYAAASRDTIAPGCRIVKPEVSPCF